MMFAPSELDENTSPKQKEMWRIRAKTPSSVRNY